MLESGIEKHAIKASTRFCAVYGHPIRHSASPAMHNAALAHWNYDWKYLAFDVDPGDLASAMHGALAMRFIGLNLTVPHKLLAVQIVDELDDSARKWGAVNTVRFEGRCVGGAWKGLGELQDEEPQAFRSIGFNTDAIARALREDLQVELRGASVLLLGAGGAGRVAALRLAMEQVREIYLVNRTREKAEEIAQEIRQQFPHTTPAVGYPAGKVDLIINATSLGLKPQDALPVDTSAFGWPQASAAYDLIYRPAKTPFLEAAAAAGLRTANGLGMLLYQGAAALEIWSGRKAPVEIMKAALLKNIYG